MKFCPKCGSIMLPQKTGIVTELVCKCGYKEEGNLDLKEKGKETKKIEVIEKQPEVHPIEEATCPKCNNTEAYAWQQQTRSADEPETRFFKCTKCEHQWREFR